MEINKWLKCNHLFSAVRAVSVSQHAQFSQKANNSTINPSDNAALHPEKQRFTTTFPEISPGVSGKPHLQNAARVREL